MQSDNRLPRNGGIRLRPEGALLRTYLRAAGVARESISKPLIGVVTVATQVFSEKPDAKELGNAVVSGVEASGGIAVRWDTVRTPDQMAYGHAESYSFAWRDQLADFIESWARQETLDGLVLVGDSHKTSVGMLMAAARLNLPALLVTAGGTRWVFKNEEADAGAQKKKAVSAVEIDELLAEIFSNKKKATAAQEQIFHDSLCAQGNHATYAMDLVLEALGLCLPGMSTAPSPSQRRHELAYASGQRIIALVQSGFSARRALTPNAFNNAIRLNSAVGGSIDVIVHLMAIAHESGVPLALDQFDRIARETPQVCRLGGVGAKDPHRLEDLDRAGGVWAVMHVLKDLVAPTTTVCGKGALELAKTSVVKDTHVIVATRPYAKQSGIGMLRGNLAPRGAAFLINQVLPALAKFSGSAEVFESEFDALKVVASGKIKKGTAIFVRGQGPKGGPGLRKLLFLPALLECLGLNKTVPVITDGRLPDTPAGLFISSVSPESMVTGPLAVLKTGDMIEIDVEKRTFGVRLTDMDMKIRQARWQAPDNKATKGFLGRYSRSVSDAYDGAVMK